MPGLRFAECLVTRLCHDLSGALSTLANALDMAKEDDENAGEALEIAAEGGAALNARLRLLRAAWGGGTGPMTLSDIIVLTDGLPTRRRLKIDTTAVTADAALVGPLARVLLNVLILAAESLPHGGDITLSGAPDQGILVMIAGRAAGWPTALPDWLSSQLQAAGDIDDPRRIVGPLTVLLADGEGIRLSFLMGGPAGLVPPLLISPPPSS